MYLVFALIATCSLLFAPMSAWAEELHALAMTGDPAFPDGIQAPPPWVVPDAPKGGTLRLSQIGTFDSMNPWIILGVPASGLGLVTQSLMARSPDEPFTLYPLIAKSVELAPDRSWIIFHLDPRAHFQDGSPITAADVLFSFRALRDHGRPHTRTYYAKVTKARALDPHTVRFDFVPDNWEMPLIMGLMPVLSKAYYQKVPFDKTTLLPPLGSGPYKVVEVDPGHRVVYQRDPDYWARDLPISAGRYNFDRIVYTWYRDANVALEAFKAGDIDLRFEDDATRWATGYDGPALASGKIHKEAFAHGRPSGLLAVAWNMRRAPFGDVRVREALGLAFDFTWTNRNLLYGAYQRTESLFDNSPLAARGPATGGELALLEPFRDKLPAALFDHPFVWPKSDGSGEPRTNLRHAAELLREAGFVLKDGKLVDGRTGKPFSFEILLGDPSFERILLPYTRNLARLGIDARLRTVDAAQYQQRIDNFNYDAIVADWGVSLSPGNEEAIYWGSAAADEPGSRNYAGIKSPVIDALIADLVDAHSHRALVDAARALDRVLMWGRYVLPLYHKTVDDVAYWDSLGHPAKTPLYGIDLSTWFFKRK